MKLFLVGHAPPFKNEHLDPNQQRNPSFYGPRILWANDLKDAVDTARERYDGTFYAFEVSVYDVESKVVRRARY